ncbi:dentin sialophosphoprotein precursor [Strigomonas culicis]|uniref:Dentin sialophosphoprotein n=1 Tax=Strigomonas culicis TaxID=28005 RepID=S9TP60_9TRYP|nr:dentin sialophosphoprotein precursor [Strigomonas culicis]|eukprot:EPY18484.1 dentin sialophosphoprotein precursor [Strigomonas culicis]
MISSATRRTRTAQMTVSRESRRRSSDSTQDRMYSHNNRMNNGGSAGGHKNKKHRNERTDKNTHSLSSSRRCTDTASSIGNFSFMTQNGATDATGRSSRHTSITSDGIGKSNGTSLHLERSSYDMATHPPHSKRARQAKREAAAARNGESHGAMEERTLNSRTRRDTTGVRVSCRPHAPLSPVLPHVMALSAEETYKPRYSTSNQRLSSRSGEHDVNVNTRNAHRNNGADGGDVNKKEAGGQRWSVRNFRKSVGQHFRAFLPSKNTTCGSTIINDMDNETDSFMAPLSPEDTTDVYSMNASFADDWTSTINGTPYNMDLFSYAATLQPMPSTRSLHTVGAVPAASCGKGEEQEPYKNSCTRFHTTGDVDGGRSRSLLPSVQPQASSLSLVTTEKPQYSIFNAETSPRRGAQDVRGKKDKTCSSDGVYAEEKSQGSGRWSVRDLPESTGQHFRAGLPSTRGTSSIADTNSRTSAAQADEQQRMEPIESSTLSFLMQEKQRSKTACNTSAGSSLLISSITKRATTSSNTKADTEPGDAAPAPPLQRDAQAQLAKWKKNVSVESASRRSMNENSVEISRTSLVQFDDMVEVRASLQSWWSEEGPAAAHIETNMC